MKTLISYYDSSSGYTITLCHFPAFDGPIEPLLPFVERETIEKGNRVLHIDYVKYLKHLNERRMKYILKNSRIVYLDFNK